MSVWKAVKLAAADGILTFAWTVLTSGLGGASLVLGNYLEWEGDRTPLVYAIILVLNLIFVGLSVASGGAARNPTAPMAFYVSGVGDDTLVSLALRIPSMAVGAAGGVWAVHEFMPGTYKHTLGPGPNLKVDLQQGALVEGVLTFVLTLIVLYTVLRGTKNRFLQTPIIVTCALILVQFWGRYTKPAMNPSDAFGWAYFNGRHTSTEHIYVYWVTPFIGALFAAGVFKLLPSSRFPPSSSSSRRDDTWDDEPMTPAGRVFTEMSSNFVCVCILGFKKPIDPQKLKSHLELTLMKHKRFSSRVDVRKGRPWWTQVETHVDDHVFEVEFTPEQKKGGDCVLNYTTDFVLPKPFDQSRPLWDVHLVEAKLGNAEGCCIVRIHHSLGDGTSLISLLMACTRSVDKPDMLPNVTTANQDKKNASPSPVDTTSFLSKLFTGIWYYLLVLWFSVIEIGKACATLLWMKDSRTVISGFSGMIDLPKKYRFITLSVDELKYVSKAMGVTINDVFMAMAAHGLRRYLQDGAGQNFQKGEFRETGQKQVTDAKIITDEAQKHVSKGLEADGLLKKLDSLRIRAVALVNMRAAPGLQELSEMMKGQASQARWGNHMGYLLLPLPMKRFSDPLELLRKMQAIGTSKKSSLEGAFSYATGSLLMKLFGQKIAAAVVTRAILQTTVSLSNVKGPTEQIMLADNPIVHIVPSVVGPPHSLTLHLQSYNGEIAIIAMSTRKLLPDPEHVLELCVEGLEELKKAVIERAGQK